MIFFYIKLVASLLSYNRRTFKLNIQVGVRILTLLDRIQPSWIRIPKPPPLKKITLLRASCNHFRGQDRLHIRSQLLKSLLLKSQFPSGISTSELLLHSNVFLSSNSTRQFNKMGRIVTSIGADKRNKLYIKNEEVLRKYTM